ncbi:MAG: HipA domain-containing protein [Chloroflexota bacterium]
MSERLFVWVGPDPVGELAREGRRFDLRFRRAEGARALLTVASDGEGDAWAPGFTRAWFDGLLPEGPRRAAAETEHGIERGDTFGLLGAIGWECAGAVSVLPEGHLPGSGSYRGLSDQEVWERLDALPRYVAEIDREVRLSLGGVQEKLLLARIDDAWQLPLDGALSTHILKPEPSAHPGLAAAETWALSVASAATESARASLLAPPGHRPTIGVERYDRLVGAGPDGPIGRVHQEDGCQVLGLAPEQKYPRGVGPRVASLGRIAAMLVARAADPTVELRRLLEQTVTNVLLLNTDAHAKNVSVVHRPDRTIALAPLYDLVPTAWFLPGQSQLALPVAGKWRIREVERGHLLAEARSWGVPARAARATIDATISAVAGGSDAADERVPGVSGEMRSAVVGQIERVAASPW